MPNSGSRVAVGLLLAGLCLLASTIALTPGPRWAAGGASAGSAGGFASEIVLAGIPRPIAFAFAPDGRIFFATQTGAVRIYKDGALVAQPFVTVPANAYHERGLMGIVLDPDFATNGYVYLYFTYENDPTNPAGPKTARLVRYTASGDEALPGSEVVLLGSVGGSPAQPSCEDFPEGADCIPGDASVYTGGGLAFAPDGALFLSTGDAAGNNPDPNKLRAQDLDSLAGKLLRVNPDGSAPSDNPFFTGAASDNRSKVWAYGFRNPFRLAVQPGTGLPFVGDVGSSYWEEIDIAEAGSNYGWPCYEGVAQHPQNKSFTECQAFYASGQPVAHPLYLYSGPLGMGATVVAGVFLQGPAYPPEFRTRSSSATGCSRRSAPSGSTGRTNWRASRRCSRAGALPSASRSGRTVTSTT